MPLDFRTTLRGWSDFLLTDLTSQLRPEAVCGLVRRGAVDGRNAGGGDAALPHLEPLWTPLRCGYKLKALAHLTSCVFFNAFTAARSLLFASVRRCLSPVS